VDRSQNSSPGVRAASCLGLAPRAHSRCGGSHAPALCWEAKRKLLEIVLSRFELGGEIHSQPEARGPRPRLTEAANFQVEPNRDPGPRAF